MGRLGRASAGRGKSKLVVSLILFEASSTSLPLCRPRQAGHQSVGAMLYWFFDRGGAASEAYVKTPLLHAAAAYAWTWARPRRATRRSDVRSVEQSSRYYGNGRCASAACAAAAFVREIRGSRYTAGGSNVCLCSSTVPVGCTAVD